MSPRSTDDAQIHGIQAVARRTGLTVDLIRAWERRYQAVEPGRSPTRRRRYTDADIERLTLLRRATLAGRRIGDVAGLPLEQLAPLVQADEAAAARIAGAARTGPRDPIAFRREALDALAALNVAGLEATLTEAARRFNPRALVADVLMPMMEEVGDRWRHGTLQVHHEHLATALVRSLLDALRAAGPSAFAGPELVVATPTGQIHELGALMSAVVAAAERWSVTYLGPDLPAEDIAAVATRRGARAVALSLVYPADDPGVRRQLIDLRTRLPRAVEILVGGRASASYASTCADLGLQHLQDFEQLSAALDRLKAARPA